MADAPDMPLYEQLARQHQTLDSQLQDLARYPLLTSAQRAREVALKKRKLALKDQMAALRTPDRAAAHP